MQRKIASVSINRDLELRVDVIAKDGFEVTLKLTRITAQLLADALLQHAGVKQGDGSRTMFGAEVVRSPDLESMIKTARNQAVTATVGLITRRRR